MPGTSRALWLLSVLLLLAGANGCAAVSTGIGKRNLEIQTQSTGSIFLDPVAPQYRTVFVEVRNTSDRPDFDLGDEVRRAIEADGYRVVENPDRAQYLLQANVRQAGVTSPTAAEAMFGGGFGGAVVGGVVGAGVGRAASSETSTIIASALLGAATESVTGALFEDVTYSITTDVQVSERVGDGVIVTQRVEQNLEQGSAGSTLIQTTETVDYKRYQTRIIATANQSNLEFEDAAPALSAGITRAIAGIF